MKLYEAHTHIALDGKDYKSMKALHSAGPNEELIRKNLQTYKDNNISFIRDGGDAWNVSYITKKIANEYMVDYRTPIYAIHKYGFYGSILGKSFSDLKEYALLVNEVKSRGGDFIKIMASGIMDFNQYQVISPCGISGAELKEMIHIAKDNGLNVMAHVNGSKEIDSAIEAGVASIEHGYYMSKDNLDGIKEAGIIWVPTLTPLSNLLDKSGFNHFIINDILKLQKDNITYAFSTGINIALGSDSGSYPVSHNNGTLTEYEQLLSIVKNEELLNIVLSKSQELLSARFKCDIG